jgi:hypothetical protein
MSFCCIACSLERIVPKAEATHAEDKLDCTMIQAFQAPLEKHQYSQVEEPFQPPLH